MLDRVLKLKDAFFLNFAVLFAYVLILNREGSYVPSNNEFVYLLYLAKLWNPNFLSNDWTFSGPLPSHLVFNLLFGPLTLVFSSGGCRLDWSDSFLVFNSSSPPPIWKALPNSAMDDYGCNSLWLFYRQSIVGGEWILGTFEAKCIAYALLFFALNGFMQQRVILPSILLGLAFSFHPRGRPLGCA